MILRTSNVRVTVISLGLDFINHMYGLSGAQAEPGNLFSWFRLQERVMSYYYLTVQWYQYHTSTITVEDFLRYQHPPSGISDSATLHTALDSTPCYVEPSVASCGSPITVRLCKYRFSTLADWADWDDTMFMIVTVGII